MASSKWNSIFGDWRRVMLHMALLQLYPFKVHLQINPLFMNHLLYQIGRMTTNRSVEIGWRLFSHKNKRNQRKSMNQQILTQRWLGSCASKNKLWSRSIVKSTRKWRELRKNRDPSSTAGQSSMSLPAKMVFDFLRTAQHCTAKWNDLFGFPSSILILTWNLPSRSSATMLT